MKILERIIYSLTVAIIAVLLWPTPQKVKAGQSYGGKYGEIPIVVSMGDSYSAGEGIEKFYDQDLSLDKKVMSEDWLAHRSTKAWGGLLELPGVSKTTSSYRVKPGEKASGNSPRWYFTAVSGAESKHFNDCEQEKKYDKYAFLKHYKGEKSLPKQIEVFDSIPANETDYVTLTLGGNDIGFTDIVTKCVTSGSLINPNLVSDTIRSKIKASYLDLKINAIEAVYRLVHEKAGDQATILVGGYPHLFNPWNLSPFINQNEATWVNYGIDVFLERINEVINKCRKEGISIYYVSVIDAFDKHEMSTLVPYINSVIIGTKSEDLKSIDKASAYSVHPNAKGAKAYAAEFNKMIKKLESEKKVTPTVTPSPTVQASGGDDLVRKEIQYDENGKETSVTEYDYDSEGRKIYEKYTMSESAYSYEVSYSYTDTGELALQRCDMHDYVEEMDYIGGRYKYSDSSKIIEMGDIITKKKNGKLISRKFVVDGAPDMYTERIYTYNSKGLLISEETARSAAGGEILNYEYNSKDQLIREVLTMDGDNKTIWEYTYDSKGRKESAEIYELIYGQKEPVLVGLKSYSYGY